MKVSMHRNARIVSVLTALAITAATFQNCSQEFTFESIKKINSITGTEEEPQYNVMKVGDGKSFPPLKLFFIVDNSGTMQANQINLSSAFSKMFAAENADNLTPFESTAYVFSTSQATMRKDDPIFARLPKKEISYFETMTLDEILAGPRAQAIDGQIPGDLVGYRTVEAATSGLTSQTYTPSPVIGFSTDMTSGRTIASTSIHREKGGSVTDFANEFSKRVALLDPARSAMDPILKTGVLDAVIDKESGLCSVARIMRNKEDYIKPGDIAAFVIVSDEEDADAKGANCIQSFKDYQGNEEYFDGYCVTPKTNITYRDVNPNPSAADCKVDYSTGFKYTYTYTLPKTDASFYIRQRDYTVRQTLVSYRTATHTFTQPRVVVSYFTKAPTYQVPQSTITYFKKVEVCDIRDGVKFNCKFEYPKFTTAPFAEAYTDCAAFSKDRLPADAYLNNANYPVTCAMLTPLDRTGACTAADPGKINCKQNYSNARTSTAPVNGTVTSTCAAFAMANANLPANAVLTDAGYEVMCADSPLNNVAGNGFCPATGKLNCVEKFTDLTSAGIDGIPTAATPAACMTYAVAKKSSLDQNAILNNANHPVTCAESAAGRLVRNNEGLCANSPANTKDCVEHNAATITNASYNGAPNATQTCKQFIQTAIGANRTISDSPAPECRSSTSVQTVTSQEKTINYSNAAVANFTPAVNDSCLDSLRTYISQTDAVPTPASCTVRSITKGTSFHNKNMLCGEIADAKSFCTDSMMARRQCVTTDVPAGDLFMANTTTATYTGQVTCDTLCSDTGFCKNKMGTVKDNFKDCVATYAPTNRNFVREPYANKDKVCLAPETATPVTTRNPYKEIGNVTDYVAGAASASGLPDALANYIRDTSIATFGMELPAVSVFVRQPTDVLGNNGTYGTSYNTFADLMQGQKKSVLSDANEYADALQSLSTVIKDKLTRSFNVPVQTNATVRRVWHRKAGEVNWGPPVDKSNWTAVGGTVTVDPNYVFEYGDEFRMESY